MPWNSTHIYDSHQNLFHVAFLDKGLLVCCFLLCTRPKLLCTWWFKLVRESFEKFLSYFVLVIYCNRLKLLVLYEFIGFPIIFCRFTSENKCRSTDSFIQSFRYVIPNCFDIQYSTSLCYHSTYLSYNTIGRM